MAEYMNDEEYRDHCAATAIPAVMRKYPRTPLPQIAKTAFDIGVAMVFERSAREAAAQSNRERGRS